MEDTQPMMAVQPISTIVYRLDSIEKQLSDMKDLLTQQQLQRKEIDGMKNDISVLESRVNNLYKEVGSIKSNDASKKAAIFDYVVKFFFAALLGFICVKVGLR